MKKMLWICCVAMVVACNSGKEKSNSETGEQEEVITDSAEIAETKPVFNPETELYIWRATMDFKKTKNPALPAGINNVDSLIWGLNEYYENVYLEKIKQGGDTLYTAIRDNKYLGSQMGTTGAEIYLADVVLNLTSVPGIKYVHIDMDTADHIEPGTWSIGNFKNYKESIR
ncbi:MAG: hypothetical protein QM687_01735 [Ferruginibacter sp.]